MPNFANSNQLSSGGIELKAHGAYADLYTLFDSVLMEFDTLIAPLTRKQFMQRYRSGVCLHVRGTPDKFAHLITLQEIEDRLNEGSNVSTPLQVVKDGVRNAHVEKQHYWTPMALKKKEVLDLIQSRHSILMMNMSQINPRVAKLLDTIEETLKADHVHADLHLYISTTHSASGYNAHRDSPQHKLYLQVIGTTEWWVYNQVSVLPNDIRAVAAAEEEQHLKLNTHFMMQPGDLFYMPPAVFHKVRNVGGPRVSFSIPFVRGDPATKRIDRTYIPFKQIFTEEMQAAKADDLAV